MRKFNAVAALVITLIGASMLLAGCGDDDSSAATATVPAATVTPTAAAVASPTASPTQAVETPASGATSAATSSPTTAATSDEAAIATALESLVQAIQQHDRIRLRDLTGDQLRQRLRDQDFDRLQSCIPDGATITILSRSVSISGNTATVTVALQMTAADGTVTTADKVWTFEQQADGTWRLSELPDCPFQE